MKRNEKRLVSFNKITQSTIQRHMNINIGDIYERTNQQHESTNTKTDGMTGSTPRQDVSLSKVLNST